MLQGKTALITGASRGIGRAIAQLYAKNGCHIAFTDLCHDENVVSLIQEIESHGVKALFIASNAADYDAAHSVIEEVVKTFGQLDILVCNAGITRDTLLMRMNEDQWDSVINVNLKSVFNYCHAATPQMMRQRSGNILSVSSVVGLHGNAGQANYAASKAGLVGFTKSIAKELATRGIRANVIAPGFIMTEMTGKFDEKMLAEWCKGIPMQRGGDVEEVAKAALFLVSDQSSYITGQVLQVDGGMSM